MELLAHRLDDVLDDVLTFSSSGMALADNPQGR